MHILLTLILLLSTFSLYFVIIFLSLLFLVISCHHFLSLLSILSHFFLSMFSLIPFSLYFLIFIFSLLLSPLCLTQLSLPSLILSPSTFCLTFSHYCISVQFLPLYFHSIFNQIFSSLFLSLLSLFAFPL